MGKNNQFLTKKIGCSLRETMKVEMQRARLLYFQAIVVEEVVCISPTRHCIYVIELGNGYGGTRERLCGRV